jgi:hypothetical protein
MTIGAPDPDPDPAEPVVEDPNAGLLADVRMLRNLLLALAND